MSSQTEVRYQAGPGIYTVGRRSFVVQKLDREGSTATCAQVWWVDPHFEKGAARVAFFYRSDTAGDRGLDVTMRSVDEEILSALHRIRAQWLEFNPVRAKEA